MKKIFKKIKVKHLARFGLVIMLCVYVATFLCSATQAVTFEGSGDSYGDYSVVLNYYEAQGVLASTTFVSDERFAISYHNANRYNSDYVVVDGVMTSRVEGRFEDISNVSLDDGYYNILLVCNSIVETVEGYDCYSLLNNFGTHIYTESDSGENYQISYFYLDEVPDTVDIKFSASTQGEAPFPEGYEITSVLIVPASPPAPQDNISNVWSNIGTWVYSSFSSVTGVFWNGTGLTLIGSICLVGTCIAICLLIFNKVRDFLNLQ